MRKFLSEGKGRYQVFAKIKYLYDCTIFKITQLDLIIGFFFTSLERQRWQNDSNQPLSEAVTIKSR